MCKHEEKYCKRCGIRFECKAGDIMNCQCNAVRISNDTRTFLEASAYSDCLCGRCMGQINQMMTFKQQHGFPKQRELMIEGLHYYYDNGFFVFTELYHLQRGFCSGNNCRHCAYGNKGN